MAIFGPLTDASVTVNGVDLSDHVTAVTIEQTTPEVDVTTMGSAFQVFTPGIPDGTITVTFMQDFAAAEIDATLSPLYSAGTPFPVVVKADSAGVGATNPTFTMGSARMYSYSPIAGDIGSALSTEVAFRNAGTAGIVRATA